MHPKLQQEIGLVVESIGGRILGLEFSTIFVESKISMSGIVRIDKRISVGIGFFYFFKIVEDRSSGLNGLKTLWLLLDNLLSGSFIQGSGIGGFKIGIKGSCILTSGLDVISLDDSKTIFASDILDGDHFAIVTDIGILTFTITFSVCFFTENGSVLGCECGSGTSVTRIKSLFF